MNTRRLYFFTATYPYGFRESFIETEIKYISKEFDEVKIIPLSARGKSIRKVPDNCSISKPVMQSRFWLYFINLLPSRTFPIFIREFIKKKVYKSNARFKAFMLAYIHSNILIRNNTVKNVIKNLHQNDVLYFYWGKGAIYILPFIKNLISKTVVRFHGAWDLWEEPYGNYAPLREKIITKIDKAVFISKTGLKYFNDHYKGFSNKTVQSYLGTLDCGICKRSEDGVIRILSCSGVVPVKRIHLILQAIKLIKDNKIIWTHIGDGPLFDELKSSVVNLPENITVNLLGRMENIHVMKYYRENPVDIFVNVSKSEGLPVALMEAISFNVPVIGTNVGGVPEIVNEQTGLLISDNPTPKDIALAIEHINKMDLMPKEFWKKSFNADINYSAFVKKYLNHLNKE